MVMLFSVFFLADTVSVMEYAGVAVLGLGIMLMAWGALASGESRRLIPFALGSACATAGYTVIDGLGARGAFIGVASFVAYGIVIWAATQAPLALVAALRETSILFAMLLGWALFGDRMDRTKIIAGGLIVAGVLLTRL